MKVISYIPSRFQTVRVVRIMFFLLVLTTITFAGYAASSLDNLKVKTQLGNLEKQLAELEKSQNTMIATQGEIIEDIRNLKVWVNKRR
ncbi:MAG: hypothetical protein HY582_03945 [Candidatus Omnitrophica bacterium]|nr:hypothetical protein [Candidatus Omnitrophota bacterium]